jgi:hypothetical protein
MPFLMLIERSVLLIMAQMATCFFLRDSHGARADAVEACSIAAEVILNFMA